LKVLDLFCGAGSWSKGFHDILPNAEFYGIDINNYNYPYNFIKADLNDWLPDKYYDIILASPPCSEFSEVKRNTAQRYDERIGLDLIYRTFALIQEIKPKFWVLENVWGLSEFIDKPKDIVRYRRAKNGKRAYLWGNFPSLGFFEEDIVYNSEFWHFRNGWNENNRIQRAAIPLALSHQIAKKIKNVLVKND